MRVADSRIKNPFEQPQLATGDQLSAVAFRVYSCFLPLLRTLPHPSSHINKLVRPQVAFNAFESEQAISDVSDLYSLRHRRNRCAEVTAEALGSDGMTRTCAVADAQSLRGEHSEIQSA